MKISDIAKIMYTLSQHNSSPDDIKVRGLVYYGRIPHKRWYEMKNEEDKEMVNWALKNTCTDIYSASRILELSGGERQRV